MPDAPLTPGVSVLAIAKQPGFVPNPPAPYVELGLATAYSFLRGASQARDLAAAAYALGHHAIGIADRNTMAGVVRMHVNAKGGGLRPVIGCRLEDRSDIPPARFWTNYIGSRILTWMTGFELLDSQSGYRLLSAALARRLGLTADGYAIESEMLIKAARHGARLEHVRVRTIYNDAGSHFRPVLDTFRISCASIYFKVFDDPR